MRVRLYDSARKVMARLAMETLARTPGTGPVLDLGSGPGLIANYLGEHQSRAVYGIDIGPRSVAASAAAAVGRNQFLVYDGEHIPFPDDFFDVVLCVEVLEHIQADGELVAEIVRVLRPGGRLLLSTANAQLADVQSKAHHVRHYRATQLVTLVEGAGFEIEGISYRYHRLGELLDTVLLRVGRNFVAIEELDDEALTVDSRQGSVATLTLAIYDVLVDPVVDLVVWHEYRSMRRSPGGSIVVRAINPIATRGRF